MCTPQAADQVACTHTDTHGCGPVIPYPLACPTFVVRQATGKDLLPTHLIPGAAGADANGLKGLSGIKVNPDDFDETRAQRRPGKKLTEAEQWEAKQLIASGVLDVREYPTFDEVRRGCRESVWGGWAVWS